LHCGIGITFALCACHTLTDQLRHVILAAGAVTRLCFGDYVKMLEAEITEFLGELETKIERLNERNHG